MIKEAAHLSPVKEKEEFLSGGRDDFGFGSTWNGNAAFEISPKIFFNHVH